MLAGQSRSGQTRFTLCGRHDLVAMQFEPAGDRAQEMRTPGAAGAFEVRERRRGAVADYGHLVIGRAVQ